MNDLRINTGLGPTPADRQAAALERIAATLEEQARMLRALTIALLYRNDQDVVVMTQQDIRNYSGWLDAAMAPARPAAGDGGRGAGEGEMGSTEFCIHYRGLFRTEVCEAGIRFDDVEGPKKPGDTSRLDRLPCFERPTSLQVPCPQRQFPTPEERAERMRLVAEHMTRWAADLAAGICPACKQPMTEKQVGRCVYASPCGHRLYQGTASKQAATRGTAAAGGE